MSIAGVVIAVVFLGVTLLWILLPLFQRKSSSRGAAEAQKQREQLLMAYERILSNIHDLDEDQSTGKMPAELYQAEREYRVRQGVAVLKALDAFDAQQPVTSTPEADEDLDRRVEAAVAAYRAKANS